MKLIMAVSAEGYAAREAKDDMSWTGKADKAIFRLLTSTGGVMGCGSNTWSMMPTNLLGRRMFKLSRKPYGADPSTVQDLEWFQRNYPSAWLIGGQTIAREAIAKGLVEQAYICHSDRKCFPTETGQRFDLGIGGRNWTQGMGHAKLADVTVEVWNWI